MKGHDPLASVVLPTFNGESCLREVLDSVFKQKASFQFEVIVIDPGSTDGTLDIIRSHHV